MSSTALQRVHKIVSELNSQAYNEGIKSEQDRILKLLDDKRAALEDKALWNALAPEANKFWLHRITELDQIIELIEKGIK